jgi:putative transposase
MPRRARQVVVGTPVHIIQRGHNRQVCFFADADYRFYLRQLEEQSQNHGCSIHAYVLMTNHIHMLLTPNEKNSVSALMKHVNQRYVRRVNRIYERTGTLWEGRFKSCVTSSDRYALACYRYIELNPVRAKMVDHPSHYRWSSYSANAEARFSSIVSPHSIYLALGKNSVERRRKYRRLVQSGLGENTINRIRHATNSNLSLDDSDE